MSHVAPRIVNDVSYASRINHESHSPWQAQYLVTLESHFSSQESECHFSWQAQHLHGEIW